MKESIVRISADQTIAGFPAVDIRRMMRETVGRSITSRMIMETLRCPEAVAVRVLNDLHAEGFVQFISGRWEPSMQGSALAMAAVSSPLRRPTAKRLINQLVERVKAINEGDTWAYRIERLVVFGSYVRGAERPNDVDIGCELLPRWVGKRQQDAEQRRQQARKERFRNLSEWAAWPKLEVLKFLKARGLSIQELDDWILESDHEILFTAGKGE